MKKSATADRSAPAPTAIRAAAPPPAPAPPTVAEPGRVRRFVIVVAGVVATHLVLYWPSLLGQKILLPLDMLASGANYLPRTPEYEHVVPAHPALSDQVLQFPLQLRFATEELRSGRLPLWDPYHFCGTPFVYCSFSPFNVPYYLIPHPVTLAWTHVLAGLVAAGGAYVFFRSSLGVGFWPAAVAAWCLPLTGFSQYWLGFYLSYTAALFPWLLVAVDRVVRRPGGFGGLALALVTGALLVSGAYDLAGQALLAAGLFALWRLGERYRREHDRRPVAAGAAALAGGWVLGFLLAAPPLLHLAEYARTGLRYQRRTENVSERPPVGLSSLPQMVLPLSYGSTERGWLWLSYAGNLQESGAQAYAGLFATLVTAPLGLASRRLRSLNLFWVLTSILASAWVLNLLCIVPVLQLPVLNTMSHNRFLFVQCFATLAVAAAGLDAVLRREVSWRVGYLVPAVCVALFLEWCLLSDAYGDYKLARAISEEDFALRCLAYTALVALLFGGFWLLLRSLPEHRRSGFLIPVFVLAWLGGWCAWRAVDVERVVPDALVRQGKVLFKPTEEGLRDCRANFRRYCVVSAAACAAGIGLWTLVFAPRAPRGLVAGALGALMVADLLWFARDQNPQFDPALYYPRLAPLDKLAHAPPGRVIGHNCLPPLLPQLYGLRDVRGYDAVDPERIVRLILGMRDERSQIFDYALTQAVTLKFLIWGPNSQKAGTVRVLPALSMLNVRYVIGRGAPPVQGDPPRPVFAPLLIHEDDYWVYENPEALPRVYVPSHVEVVSPKQPDGVLKCMLAGEAVYAFDPRAVAYVTTDPQLPADCRGTAELVAETPREVRVAVDMQTPGLLVLADQWYQGWNAYLDGKPVPVLVANYALRGVPLPAGRGTVVFRYEPTGWGHGMILFWFAAASLASWVIAATWLGRQRATRAAA
jgi:hypothetical protein